MNKIKPEPQKSNSLIILVFIIIIVVYFWAHHKNKKEELPPEEVQTRIEVPRDNSIKAEVDNRPQPPPPNPPSPLKIDSTEVAKIRNQAKGALMNVYLSEKVFFVEQNRYTSDLSISAIPPTEQVMPYKFGFLNENWPSTSLMENENPHRKDSDTFLDAVEVKSKKNYEYSDDARNINLSQFQSFCKSGCGVNPNGYEMILVVPLGDNEHLDVWLLNDKKEIIQVKDGTQN